MLAKNLINAVFKLLLKNAGPTSISILNGYKNTEFLECYLWFAFLDSIIPPIN